MFKIFTIMIKNTMLTNVKVIKTVPRAVLGPEGILETIWLLQALNQSKIQGVPK